MKGKMVDQTNITQEKEAKLKSEKFEASDDESYEALTISTAEHLQIG